MSSRRPSLRLAVAGALLAAGLAGCSGDDEPPAAPARGATDVVRAIDRALDARAHLARRGDAAGFRRLLAGTPAFRRQQATWLGNLAQLPLARLSYRLDPASLVSDGGGYTVSAQESLQLAGYDAAPVTSLDRFRFVADPAHAGRVRLAAVTGTHSQPWDLGPVVVRERAGVLGVFDSASAADASSVLTSIEDGVAAVAAEVPYPWSRSVVVYALSDPAFLDTLEDVPGDDPAALDAVAFPAGTGTRVVLNPRVLADPGAERDRLVRHELTHVALGARDDDVPVWLSEGLAEYVSVRPLPPQDRRIAEAAVAAARAGIRDLPADASFNDEDSDAHYGLAWWAVEYLARTYGEDAPWRLLDAMGRPGAQPAAVLHEQLGTSTPALAGQASRLILSLYDTPAGTPTRTP